MLSLEESLKILKKTNALIEGHFILSSGLHSSKYVQCAKLMSIPNEAVRICQSLAEKIKKELTHFDIILSASDWHILTASLGMLINCAHCTYFGLCKPEESIKCPSIKALVFFKIFKDSSNESIFLFFMSYYFKIQIILFNLTYQVSKIFQIFNL